MEGDPPQLRSILYLVQREVKVLGTSSVQALGLTQTNAESAENRSHAVLSIEFQEHDLLWLDQSSSNGDQ